ncbi:uncharacterized protein B0H18DRAFT_982956 [Fomitopsis serialis]|uniref:uncharacterized protein n=1 Tax=Fomitopsis serialis TaxID=139415 RepID=UPI00200778C9|nr:uncharacterized protein B0H18DRAFT_982956 [Neoantrodia serialis]KAH9933305.1 hypothetical protein B0H18DRAFT_982956 [Neoantrodia serialis]
MRVGDQCCDNQVLPRVRVVTIPNNHRPLTVVAITSHTVVAGSTNLNHHLRRSTYNSLSRKVVEEEMAVAPA